MSLIDDFFVDIDECWPRGTAPRIRLSIIGSGALMLQANYERGTKDSDVFETMDLSAETKAHLARIAGRGTELNRRRKLYIDIVNSGLPFLPHVPRWHPAHALNAKLDHLAWFVLDVIDVVVSKLQRFDAHDEADIDAMIQRGVVSHERLIERFRAAVDERLGNAYEVELPVCIANLHRVERDMLDVPETEIELPSWI